MRDLGRMLKATLIVMVEGEVVAWQIVASGSESGAVCPAVGQGYIMFATFLWLVVAKPVGSSSC